MGFLTDWLTDWIKGLLIEGIMGNLTGLFDTVNTRVGEIAVQVGTTPAAWNAGVFSLIRQLSETVILPIAGLILTFVATYELSQLIIEKNNLHDLDYWIFFKWIFKTAAAILILSNAFNIVMAVFDMKKLRVLLLTLCVAVFMCGFTVTAHAGGGDEYMEPTDQWEGLDEPTPTIEPGEGFSDEGNLVTRDLLYDEHTNKQFITVQTSGGNTFYIVIDYDKPVDEDGEQYETYFFSIVDEADLLAAMEAAGMEVPACACTDKCMAGAINTDCPVCATNMTECVGVEPEPVEDTEPVGDPELEQPENTGGIMGTILLVLAIAAVGGGAGWYFKVYRPKQQRAAEAVEEDYGDELDAFDDPEDDTPPWDEDEV